MTLIKNPLRLALILSLFLCGCSRAYYLILPDEEVSVYSDREFNNLVYRVPPGQGFFSHRQRNGYRKVRYGQHAYGFIIPQKFINESKKGKSFVNNYQYQTFGSTQISNNSTSSSTKNKSKSTGGRVNVKGYTKKNGTYVAPHTRSAPRRR